MGRSGPEPFAGSFAETGGLAAMVTRDASGEEVHGPLHAPRQLVESSEDSASTSRRVWRPAPGDSGVETFWAAGHVVPDYGGLRSLLVNDSRAMTQERHRPRDRSCLPLKDGHRRGDQPQCEEEPDYRHGRLAVLGHVKSFPPKEMVTVDNRLKTPICLLK